MVKDFDVFLFEFNDYYSFKKIDEYNNKLNIHHDKILIYNNSHFYSSYLINTYLLLKKIYIEDANIYGTFDFINTDDKYSINILNILNFNCDIDYNYGKGDMINISIHGFNCFIDETTEYTFKKRIRKIKDLKKNILINK